MLELFVGDDWAEEHHDVELMDPAGRRLAQARLPEGVAGMARLHAMIAAQLGEAVEDAVVKVGIETDRGPWAQALIAAGYEVFAVNPLQAARYRERHSVSGAKSDKADAHTLADMVRTDSHQLRPVAADTPRAEAIKVVARAHKTLIWERTRHTQRLRHALREYFPAALEAFEDLAASDTLELLSKAPDPGAAARLSISQISAALRRAGRRKIEEKAAVIQTALRAEHLRQPEVVVAAYAASVQSTVAVLKVLVEQVKTLQGQVESHSISGTMASGRSLWKVDRNVVDGVVNGTGWLTLFSSWASGLADKRVVDGAVNSVGWTAEELSYWFRRLQTGLVQNYALLMLGGVVVFVGLYWFMQ